MTIRTRLTVTSAALLVAAVTTACGGGGGGAPSDASEEDFCAAQSSLVENLLPDDMADPEMPSNEDMAKAVQDWGAEIEEVGTPEGISDDARAGFEAVVEQADDIDASDFTMEKLEELEMGGADASAEVKEQAQAFSDYLTETCGNPMDDLELPEVPDMSETP
jgi:hypothetical protein